LRQCLDSGDGNFDRLIALLRRFEVDAACEFGKRGLEKIKRETPVAAQERVEPVFAAYEAPTLTSDSEKASLSAAAVVAALSVASTPSAEFAPAAEAEASVASEPTVAIEAVAASEPIPAAAMAEPTLVQINDELEIFVDLGALEKELIAA
jgi:hypothetical protein